MPQAPDTSSPHPRLAYWPTDFSYGIGGLKWTRRMCPVDACGVPERATGPSGLPRRCTAQSSSAELELPGSRFKPAEGAPSLAQARSHAGAVCTDAAVNPGSDQCCPTPPPLLAA